MDGSGKSASQIRSERLNHTGIEYYTRNDIGSAYMHFMGAVAADRGNLGAWTNISACLNIMQKHEAAEATCRLVLQSDPSNPFVKNNLAASLMGQRRHAEAMRIYEDVLSISRKDPGLFHNYGVTLLAQELYPEGLAALASADKINPGNVGILNDKAIARLAIGDLRKGLEEYEIRWKRLHQHAVWRLGVQEWQGEDLKGASLLVHHEQGFGDSLMLCRFIPELIELGARVTLAVPKELVRLFRFNFPKAEVVDWDVHPFDAADYDYHTPLLSVLRHLGYERPEEIPSSAYLKAPGTFRHQVPEANCKIGLCWGSGDHGFAMRQRRRIVDLTKFLNLVAVPGVRLVSLQKGELEKDLEYAGTQAMITNLFTWIEDFADTADLIQQLDLVITVDSAVAHLAGALGKPTIMLSPYPRCWRWWGETNGAPWYDYMTIYKQNPNGTWDNAVRAALHDAGYIGGRD